jgi:ABC transport system ATP-binding/permease protein
MSLLSLQEVSVSFGGDPLLEKVNLQVERGERIALLGRNGEGKTTLLKLIRGEVLPDTGAISLQKGTFVAGLSQDLPSHLAGTVLEVVAGGIGGGPVSERDPRRGDPMGHSGESVIQKLREPLEDGEGWRVRRQVELVLTRLSLEGDAQFETLSVGFKRRVLLARALVTGPDLLLLDEPTNHLDIETIDWMEGYLQNQRGGTLIFVTHDRMFLQKLATRILELDRGRLTSWACDYRTFLERREEALAAEEAQRSRFLRKLSREEEWIRKGIKARRTRNEGRVRALMKMREKQQALRSQAGVARIQIQEAENTGKVVMEVEEISHGYGGPPLINHFSVKILRGDRIGIIGPNGVGKSTLLRILLGDVAPQKGEVRRGTRLQVVYFDQLRESLEEDLTVQENIAEGKEIIDINGSRRHVIGYLKDFLFSPDRARSPVRILSGGERNRLLLARLLSRPCNLLVLDEPTNDLDMETLELLEERLLEYAGTMLLVSHDREFLNHVTTSTLVFEGEGVIGEYAGGYDDWRVQCLKTKSDPDREKRLVPPKKRERIERPRKLSFKESQELEGLPGRIEKLEQEQKSLYRQMGDPEFYRGARERISKGQARLDELKMEIEGAYERWEELELIREME